MRMSTVKMHPSMAKNHIVTQHKELQKNPGRVPRVAKTSRMIQQQKSAIQLQSQWEMYQLKSSRIWWQSMRKSKQLSRWFKDRRKEVLTTSHIQSSQKRLQSNGLDSLRWFQKPKIVQCNLENLSKIQWCNRENLSSIQNRPKTNHAQKSF